MIQIDLRIKSDWVLSHFSITMKTFGDCGQAPVFLEILKPGNNMVIKVFVFSNGRVIQLWKVHHASSQSYWVTEQLWGSTDSDFVHIKASGPVSQQRGKNKLQLQGEMIKLQHLTEQFYFKIVLNCFTLSWTTYSLLAGSLVSMQQAFQLNMLDKQRS